ncbi:hypothetical protein DL96DRAFT_1623117, partial [Flagelloscypha sp. PMI_526]
VSRIPIELIEHIISYIHNFQDLKACCLASRVFVPSTQAKLFRRLRSIVSTPHILTHVRSVVASHRHSFLQDVKLTLEGGTAWRSSLLQILGQKIFPFLTSLILHSVDAPISIVTSCKMTMCDLLAEGDEGYADLIERRGLKESSLPVKRLTLDGTRNNDGTFCALVSLIADHRLPSLVCLDFLHHVRTIMEPLWNRLCFLDIGHWEGSSWISNDPRYFHLHNYPNLVFFAIQMKGNALGRVSYESTLQLAWLSETFESVVTDHPLRLFALRLEDNWSPENPDAFFVKYPLSQGWDKLDSALQNRNLSTLSQVTISVGPKVELIPVFERNLTSTKEAGKLSFQAVDMLDYFRSMSEVKLKLRGFNITSLRV